MKLQELVMKIKEKRELSGIVDSVVNKALLNYMKKYRKSLEDMESMGKRERKVVIKYIRAELRLYTGRFQKDARKRGKMVETGDVSGLLMTHISTRERVDSYPKLKNFITGLKVKSILDLGCGLNPIALAKKGIFYYASDIKQDELEIIELFFKKKGINGKIFVHDIREGVESLPEADLCLLFKVFEVVEKKYAEKILTGLKCKYILVSFPLQKISGRMMKRPEREWMNALLSRIKYKYQTFKIGNEIFYFINKD